MTDKKRDESYLDGIEYAKDIGYAQSRDRDRNKNIPNGAYIISEATLRGLESAGCDLTGDSFASDDSRVEFVKELCREVRACPYTVPAREQL